MYTQAYTIYTSIHTYKQVHTTHINITTTHIHIHAHNMAHIPQTCTSHTFRQSLFQLQVIETSNHTQQCGERGGGGEPVNLGRKAKSNYSWTVFWVK